MSNTLKPMNCKISMNIKALLNVHNFITEPPLINGVYNIIEVYKIQLLRKK